MADTVILRTFTQVQEALYTYFQSNNQKVLLASGAGTGPGDLLDDVATEFGNGIYIILTFLQEIKSIAGLQRLTSGDSGEAAFLAALQAALGYTSAQMTALLQQVCTDKGTDYDKTINPATQGTLNLEFYTATFGSGTGSIPQGTTAQTAGLTPIQYKTMIAVNNAPLLGPVTTPGPYFGMYFIDVASQAVNAGSASNVPVGVVNQLIPPISGFTSVTNTTASAGGLNQETLPAFLARVQASEKGRDLGTLGGLESFFGSQDGVEDNLPVDATSSLMTRGDENQVDVWIMGVNDQPATDVVTYTAALMGGSVIMNNQPVTSVTSVLVGAVTQVLGVDYTFAKDIGGFSGSVRGVDSIVWINQPADASVVTINYFYNSLISQLQNLISITNPDNYLLNNDILVRQAVQVLINMAIHVVPQANYSATQMQANVIASVEAYFAQFLLAPQLFQNNVIDVIDATTGVGHSEPFVTFAPVGQTGASDQLLGANQWATVNQITFI